MKNFDNYEDLPIKEVIKRKPKSKPYEPKKKEYRAEDEVDWEKE